MPPNTAVKVEHVGFHDAKWFCSLGSRNLGCSLRPWFGNFAVQDFRYYEIRLLSGAMKGIIVSRAIADVGRFELRQC